jgi:hypothetical protein
MPMVKQRQGPLRRTSASPLSTSVPTTPFNSTVPRRARWRDSGRHSQLRRYPARNGDQRSPDVESRLILRFPLFAMLAAGGLLQRRSGPIRCRASHASCCGGTSGGPAIRCAPRARASRFWREPCGSTASAWPAARASSRSPPGRRRSRSPPGGRDSRRARPPNRFRHRLSERELVPRLPHHPPESPAVHAPPHRHGPGFLV